MHSKVSKTATKSLANVSITYRDSPVFVSEANVFRNASMKTTDTREAYRLQKMLLSPPKSIVCFFPLRLSPNPTAL